MERHEQQIPEDAELGPEPPPCTAQDADDDGDVEEARRDRAKLIARVLLWLCSLAFILVGAIMSSGKRTVGAIDKWKWWLLGGLIVPIWDISTAVFNVVYGLFEYQGRSRRDKAAYFLIPLRKSLLNVVRWAFYTATWASLMNHETSPTERTVFVNVLKAHIAMMILWLAHGLGIGVAKAIALRFYTSNFFDRMQTSLEHEFYLHALAVYKAPHVSRPSSRATGIRRVSRPGVKAKGLEEISRQSGRESASEIRTAPGSDPTTGWDTPAVGGSGDGVMKASDLSKLMSELRDLAFTTTEGEQIGQLLKLQRFITTHKPQAAFASRIGKVTASSTEQSIARSSKRLTKLIFKNLARDGKNFLEKSDLKGALPPEMLEPAFNMLNPVEGEKVIQSRCEASINEVFNKRKELKRALKDSKTMVGSLRKVLIALFSITGFFIIMAIFRVQIGNLWVSFTSLVLAGAFIFGNTLRIMFETLVRHFGTHPFDVEDKLEVPGLGWVSVKEMTLWETILVDWRGRHHMYPNATLFNMAFVNVSRSDRYGDEFVLWLDADTDPGIYEVLWRELEDFRIANPQHFGSWLSVRLQMCSTNGLKIRLAIYYEFAWCMADLGAIGDARNLMLVKVLTVLKAHKVRLSGRQEVSLAPAEHTATGVPLSSLGLPWSTQFGPTAPFYARSSDRPRPTHHGGVPLRSGPTHQRNASEPAAAPGPLHHHPHSPPLHHESLPEIPPFSLPSASVRGPSSLPDLHVPDASGRPSSHPSDLHVPHRLSPLHTQAPSETVSAPADPPTPTLRPNASLPDLSAGTAGQGTEAGERGGEAGGGRQSDPSGRAGERDGAALRELLGRLGQAGREGDAAAARAAEEVAAIMGRGDVTSPGIGAVRGMGPLSTGDSAPKR